MTAKRTALQVVRAGNPGKRAVPETPAVPPAEFTEPHWSDLFRNSETEQDATEFCRRVASATWRRVVPVMEKSVGLGSVDFDTVVDYCICVARLYWCERRLSVEGLIVEGRQAGMIKNPLTTVATQYRTQLKTYIKELGLSPAARTGMSTKPSDDDSDNPFD